MPGKIKVAIGSNGELASIDEVKRGAACNCACIDCHAPLIAKKGEYRDNHFAHHIDYPCTGSLESYLHKLAKILLSQSTAVYLPVIGLFAYDETIAENQLSIIRPDVTLIGEREVHIEVYCTNKKSDEDIKKYKTLGASAFELDMSEFKEDIDLESIHRWIIDAVESKTVLNLPEVNSYKVERSDKKGDGCLVWIAILSILALLFRKPLMRFIRRLFR